MIDREDDQPRLPLHVFPCLSLALRMLLASDPP
jgi:hypothetical protein